MTTTPTPPRLAVKVRRQVWIEEEHPRDRKGRWIETGAEVRVWGGWLGKVIRNVGGGRIEVERLTDGKHVIIHRNYLTVTKRPDGSDPTNSRDVNPAALPEGAASPDAVDADTPDAPPAVDTPGQSGNVYDLLVEAGDQSQADLVRQAAADYQTALGNGVPDDEADERDGLLHVLDEVEATYAYDSEDKPKWDAAIALLREAAEVEPPAPGRDWTPVSVRLTAGGARQVATALDEQGGEHGIHVDGEKVTVTDPDKAGTFIEGALPISDLVAENEALPEVMRTSFVLRSEALRSVAALVQNAKRVYTGGEEDQDERTGGTGEGALGEVPPGSVREPDRPGDVLSGTGDGSGAPDQRTRGGAEGTGRPGRDVGDPGGPVLVREVERGGAGQEGGRVPPGREPGPDGGDSGRPDGRDDGVRGRPAGVPDGAGSGDDGVAEKRRVGAALLTIRKGDRVTVSPQTYTGMVSVLAAYDQNGEAEYDLGLVSIEGTDLFKPSEHDRTRMEMPQLSGKPVPGGPSDGRPTNARGNVNVKPVFLDRIRAQGIDVRQENVPVATLHATQSDLNGPAVGRIFLDMLAGTHDGTGTIVTNDGYVLDGHHQWAAQVAVDARDGELGNLAVPMTRIDMSIEDALSMAEVVSRDEGILPAGIGRADNAGDVPKVTMTRADVDADLAALADEPDASEPEMTRIDPDRAAFEDQRAAESDATEGRMDGVADGASGEPRRDMADRSPEYVEGYDQGFNLARAVEEQPEAVAEGFVAALGNADVPDEVHLSQEEIDRAIAELGPLDSAEAGLPEPWVPPADFPTEWGTDMTGDASLLGRRVKYGERDVTVTGVRGHGHPYDVWTVTFVDDEGAAGRFDTRPGEKPIPAPPNVAIENLYAPLIAQQITENDEDGVPRPVLRPRVGTWRTRVDPDAAEGVIAVTGEHGVTGTMRATLDGWAGSIDVVTAVSYSGRQKDYGDPITVPPDPDPQVVLERLYEAVNGPGAAARTRREETAGRAPAPEVPASWETMPVGTRLTMNVDGADQTVVFASQYAASWNETPRTVHAHTLPDENGEQRLLTLQIPRDERPRAGVPELGAEGELVEDEGIAGPAYEPDQSVLSGVVAGEVRFQPTGADDFAQAGTMTKLDANLEALRTLRTLDAEHRPATPEEQAVLARWAGWGGLADVFDPTKTAFDSRREELYGLLDDPEILEARRNTLNAHYTDAEYVKRIWAGVQNLGLTEGRVLEPGSGSGTFIGFRARRCGHGRCGTRLHHRRDQQAPLPRRRHPQRVVRRTNVPAGSFDGAVGNVPFGRFSLHDPNYNPEGFSIHNHFISKTLDLTRHGGIVALLTSRYTLDAQDDTARKAIAEKADLIGAIRLPNGSHSRVAGTAGDRGPADLPQAPGGGGAQG